MKITPLEYIRVQETVHECLLFFPKWRGSAEKIKYGALITSLQGQKVKAQWKVGESS